MKDKQTQVWDNWTASLTEATQRALKREEPSALPLEKVNVEPEDEESNAYDRFRLGLSAEATEHVDALRAAPDNDNVVIDPATAKYCLVESEDGEWATLRVFKTAEGMARRLGQIEGEDIVVWPFFGIPMQFTKGPQRYLLLPNGKTVIQIPMYDGAPLMVVPAELIKNDMQDDGFVGPHELANTRIVSDKLEKASKSKAAQDDDDEDDDEVGVH